MSQFKKKIFGLANSCHQTEFMGKGDPFEFQNLRGKLETSGAKYVGKAEDVCRDSYVYFFSKENVYLTCLYWLECEYERQVVYLAGDTQEAVEKTERKLNKILFQEKH